MATDTNVQAAPKPEEPQKKSRVFLVILILIVLVGGWFGISKYLHSLNHESTEDAQVATNISPVIPRIAGYVTEVRIGDNQPVKKGDTLLVLDSRDLQIKVEQAEAALEVAKSNLNAAQATTTASRENIGSSKAAVATADAQIEQAKINVWRATQDYNRYANLIKDHSITQQQYEQAQAAKQTAESQLKVLEQQRAQAATQINVTTSQSGATGRQIAIAAARIKEAEAQLNNARLNLSYAVVTAPADGLVSKVNIQPGQFLNAGQSLFSIVLDRNLWVIANFKETQLNKMAEGQEVDIKADAFPDHDFRGTITSFSAATGSSFALLPPDNASGNFVKVVQRVPVKIEFVNKNDKYLDRLRAGMNVEVEVELN